MSPARAGGQPRTLPSKACFPTDPTALPWAFPSVIQARTTSSLTGTGNGSNPHRCYPRSSVPCPTSQTTRHSACVTKKSAVPTQKTARQLNVAVCTPSLARDLSPSPPPRISATLATSRRGQGSTTPEPNSTDPSQKRRGCDPSVSVHSMYQLGAKPKPASSTSLPAL